MTEYKDRPHLPLILIGHPSSDDVLTMVAAKALLHAQTDITPLPLIMPQQPKSVHFHYIIDAPLLIVDHVLPNIRREDPLLEAAKTLSAQESLTKQTVVVIGGMGMADHAMMRSVLLQKSYLPEPTPGNKSHGWYRQFDKPAKNRHKRG